MRKPALNDYRLYLVTDSRLNNGYPVLKQVELALQGGIKLIQLREKELSTSQFIELASEAIKLTRKYDAFLIINDNIEVAQAVNADGIHLGMEDMPISEARQLFGNVFIIGASVKTAQESIKAEKDGADYLAVNGVFNTQSKLDLGSLPGLEGVREIRKYTKLPLLGIGGITLKNCREVIEAGADGIAVITAITMSDDIPSTINGFFGILRR